MKKILFANLLQRHILMQMRLIFVFGVCQQSGQLFIICLFDCLDLLYKPLLIFRQYTFKEMQKLDGNQEGLPNTKTGPFQVYLTKGQVAALEKLLPLRYSLQLETKKRGNQVQSCINKNKQASHIPKNRQLDSIRQQIKDNQPTSDVKKIDRKSTMKDNLRSTSLKKKSTSNIKSPPNHIHSNTERQFYGDSILVFLNSVKQKPDIVLYYKGELKIIEEKVIESLNYSLRQFQDDFNELLKMSDKPRATRKFAAQKVLHQLYSKWQQNIKLELQTGRISQNQTETNHQTAEKISQIQKNNRKNNVKKPAKQLTTPKEKSKPKNLTKKMGKTNKEWKTLLQNPKLIKNSEVSTQITGNTQKIQFPEACKIMRRLKMLSSEDYQSVLEEAKMPYVDTLAIRQSTRTDLKPFLDSLNRILQSKYHLSLFDEESSSESEEYIESSFEIQDEL